ncbi:aryl-alcohol dehydrogenase-like predicted oxidoreductase [Methylohalomonas lacus]|uniref:Aryl-alcohol dehydrogenase-like predicted oxidoreductase n=1 Tax=Methylohalomonas lacus TaxID=398773 RepID=A0AAE3L0H1_9GAMM|nr:aldo/keto reductase [Methylohalomonas lacus]MCS3902499.1 aryl-alcohol dehydrogenase-like predicted oxidoreductase [Methylohalomonas lacus]
MTLRRRLADTELTAVGLGAMPLSLAGAPEPATAIDVIHRFIDAGGDFIDSANVYSSTAAPGDNERLIARALSQHPQGRRVHVATKGGVQWTGRGWRANGRPQALRQACEQSLRDLDVERIFLYQLHAPDPDVDISESVGVLRDLQAAGRIAHIGLSNIDDAQLARAAEVTSIASVQNGLHPRRKQSLADGVVTRCREHGIAFIAHSPVGGYHDHARLADDKELRQLAQRYVTSVANLAIAWLLQLDEHMFVIAGARRVASVLASQRAMELALDADVMRSINRLVDW